MTDGCGERERACGFAWSHICQGRCRVAAIDPSLNPVAAEQKYG